MWPTKIVVIGAGSAIFGLNTLGALMRNPMLHGSQIALVDRNPETLDLIERLAKHINQEWGAKMQISAHLHHAAALEGAEFVVLAIEVSPREALWQSDYEIPLKYGVRQPYAENGGPGGFAHAARNIGPVMEIAGDMEKACPNAWLINFTNPMIRICDAVSRYSKINVVGLCHQIKAGYAMVGQTLAEELDIEVPEGFISTAADLKTMELKHRVTRQAMEKVDILAAGLNHFTWMLDIRDKRTGEDLYPRFQEKWQALPKDFEPLTRQVYEHFGLFPIPGDEHLCEYLPWMSDPITKPWEKLDIALYDWDAWANYRDDGYKRIKAMMASGTGLEELLDVDSEGALEMITNIAGAGQHTHLAVNLPNRGYISNLPEGAIVEVPGVVSGLGVQGIGVGPLPDAIAELCRREVTVAQLCVDAAVHGDRQAAIQCLLLDPIIRDMDVAVQILDDYLQSYREYLPQFWN